MTCVLPDCARAQHARGWCRMHHRRWLKTGDPLGKLPGRIARVCAVDGCAEQLASHGWCGKHLQRWKRHGDPLKLVKQSPEKGRLCSVPRCGGLHHAHGFCGPHAQRFVKYGDPLAGGEFRIMGDDAKRFWSKVAITAPDVCWIWTGSRDGKGYGEFRTGETLWRAHRWAYRALMGSLDESLTIDHLCRTPLCVNPAHMEQVTSAENTRRGWERRIEAGEPTPTEIREARRRIRRADT